MNLRQAWIFPRIDLRLAKKTLGVWIVSILGILLTLVIDALYNPPTPQELGVPVTQAPAYLMTLPYHPLLNLLVFPSFAWWYLRGLPKGVNPAGEAWKLGAFWVGVTMIVDLIVSGRLLLTGNFYTPEPGFFPSSRPIETPNNPTTRVVKADNDFPAACRSGCG